MLISFTLNNKMKTKYYEIIKNSLLDYQRVNYLHLKFIDTQTDVDISTHISTTYRMSQNDR